MIPGKRCDDDPGIAEVDSQPGRVEAMSTTGDFRSAGEAGDRAGDEQQRENYLGYADPGITRCRGRIPDDPCFEAGSGPAQKSIYQESGCYPDCEPQVNAANADLREERSVRQFAALGKFVAVGSRRKLFDPKIK